MEEQTQAQESLLDSNTTTETNTETTTATETATVTDEQRPEWLPEKFKTAEDFAKSYSELEKKIQEKQPEIPTEYDYSYAGDMGLDMNDEQKSQTNEVFRHYGLTQEQAKGMLSLYSDSIKAFADQYTAQGPQIDMTVEQGTLKNTWGAEYDTKMGAVRNFAKTLKNDTLNAPLANTAEGLQILADAMAYRNGTNPIADGGVASTQSAADIRAKINELRQSDSYKLPQGDIVGEQTRAEIYKLYQQLERMPR
tara:strand:+ start:6180 stop:6935 length:756 start_codon:yes stop_codon:yes gene_type:complete